MFAAGSCASDVFHLDICVQVLNLLLYGLTGRPVDEQLMEFLAVDEHLVDIGDDLVDYEASFFSVAAQTQVWLQRPLQAFMQGLPCSSVNDFWLWCLCRMMSWQTPSTFTEVHFIFYP